MIAAGLTGLVAGWLFGLRFRVAVLLLVELSASTVGLGVALSGAAPWLPALEAFALFSTCLQASYILAVASPVAVRREAAVRVEA